MSPVERIDPWRACRLASTLSGRASLADMPRLAEAALGLGAGCVRDAVGDDPSRIGPADSGTVSYELCFGLDPSGRPTVVGWVRGSLRLGCQRCLEAFEMTVDAPIALAFVREDREALDLPDHLEPWLVTDESVRPAEILEDELLLSIPPFPRHDSGPCAANPGSGSAAAGAEDSGTLMPDTRPFAVLAALKPASDT